MTQNITIKTTSKSFVAYNASNEAVAFVYWDEETCTTRIDYKCPCGWETENINCNFYTLRKEDVVEILESLIQF